MGSVGSNGGGDDGSDQSGESAADESFTDSGAGGYDDDLLARDADFNRLNVPAGDRNKLASLEAECETLRQEALENRDKYLRALAEFENYKKRALKERSDLLKYQGKEMLQEFVEVVDDLERAVEASQNTQGIEELRRGVELILKLALDTLTRFGVRGESGLGQQFNPQIQNALSRIPAVGVDPNTVVNELKKTYFYKDIVLRHGQVVVAEAVAEPPAPESAEDPTQAGIDQTEM